MSIRTSRLDQQAPPGHLRWLLNTHSSQDRRRHITQHCLVLGQTPALGSIGHDEGHLVGGVRGLGLALLVEHLLGVAAKNQQAV